MEQPMGHQQLNIRSEDGRNVAAWFTSAARQGGPRRIVVLVPGFGRRMHHDSAFAQYLIANGFDVLRYDSLDHPGMSDGNIYDFTMSAGLASLRAVLGWAAREFPHAPVGVLATSLGAPIAMRAATDFTPLRYLITVSGVVHLQKTLAHVCGTDYAAVPIEQVPPSVKIEGREVDAHRFYLDSHAGRWLDQSFVEATLHGLSIPVVTFIGEQDQWVDAADLTAVMRADAAGARSVITLSGSGHDIGRHAAMARVLLNRVVRQCLAMSGREGQEVHEPSCASLMESALDERRQQRRQREPAAVS